MAIAEKLQAVLTGFEANVPEAIKTPINRSRAELLASFDKSKTPQPGNKLPEFTLTNATGKSVTREDLLAQGALLITFYRGNWCPFCNIALHGLQAHLPEFKAKGVRLVAISPELPDQTLTTKEKNELEFEVLSDVDNKFARQLGIIWKMPTYLKATFEGFGESHDFVKRHGNDNFEVPVPTNLLVNKDGTIVNVFVEPDYTKRLEPSTAVEWANAL